ncbi:MAG: glutathione S-transferase [Phenylobacterium sp.]|uniref:glutathione S-transferase family protein n=1 Tax=Phenylobacterium sp. TaxID=1871053 RepID=UPI0025CCD5A2|nr:glutathione S-transferase family protein [Phenylobacterium sp.]MBA4011472.1 glutathione S-transferase [Phenylobacterium sp.]
MITLYGAGANFGLPEVSPYVTKTEVHLRMAGLAYAKQAAPPQMSPKGQLPWMDDDGELIADSHFIRLHLERKYGVDFDEGLSVAERAQAWAIERMVENHLGWTLVNVRWLIPENYAKGPAQFFSALPPAMQDDMRRDIQGRIGESLRAVGIGRHTDDEILGLGVRSLAALSALLGDKPFLMGARPTGVDAVAFGVLAGLMIPFFEAPIRERAMSFDNLAGYVDRMMAGVYPEFAWTPLNQRSEFMAA